MQQTASTTIKENFSDTNICTYLDYLIFSIKNDALIFEFERKTKTNIDKHIGWFILLLNHISFDTILYMKK